LTQTSKILDLLNALAETLVKMSDDLSQIAENVIREEPAPKIRALVLNVTKKEEAADSMFEQAATEIMAVEFLNVNPDHLLDIAKHIDQISDLIERAALLFQYLTKFEDEEIGELLTSCAQQVRQITYEFARCLRVLDENENEVERICLVINDREKAVDSIREKFNAYAITKMGLSEHRIWMKDIFGYMDEIADVARELTITVRVVAKKLEKQRNFIPKKLVEK
jgi:uncharacterized protein Yka (UPF0111/DUF47 family)